MSNVIHLQINSGPPCFQSFPDSEYIDELCKGQHRLILLFDSYTENQYLYDHDNNMWVLVADSKSFHNLTILQEDIMTENRNPEEFGTVSLLGNQNTHYSDDYSPKVLETFVNKHQDNDYVVTFDAYEFTSKCPKTGQPDFAKVVISYIPNVNMVESKSLKLYLFSFRNHGDFHEDCMNIIMKDLIKLMNPKYIEVRGIFSPRGGISILPFVNWANPDFSYQTFASQRQLDMLRDSASRTVRYDM